MRMRAPRTPLVTDCFLPKPCGYRLIPPGPLLLYWCSDNKVSTASVIKNGTGRWQEQTCCTPIGSPFEQQSFDCCLSGSCDGKSKQCQHVNKYVKRSWKKNPTECTDPKRQHHIIIKIGRKGNFAGDACCDSQHVHMINLEKHCCSRSNGVCEFVPLDQATHAALLCVEPSDP